MKPLVERLRLKARAVVQDFASKIDECNDKPKNVTNEKLFKSMKRWHKNSHISERDWQSSFKDIEHKLDVVGKMKLEEDFKGYLDAKFKLTSKSLTKGFSITPILDFLETDIRSLYQRKLNERAAAEAGNNLRTLWFEGEIQKHSF